MCLVNVNKYDSDSDSVITTPQSGAWSTTGLEYFPNNMFNLLTN